MQIQKRTFAEWATAKERSRPVQVIAQTSRPLPDLKDTLSYLLRRTRLALRADAAAVLLFDEASLRLKPIVSDGLYEAVEKDAVIPLGKGIAGLIATSLSGLIFHNVAEMPVISGASRGGVKSVAGLPLRMGGRLLGVIYVGSVAPLFFKESDLLILTLVGERVAVAIERERVLEAEKHKTPS